MNETILVPAAVSAPCLARGRLGFGFGRRFFFLFLCGMLWIIPGFWNRTFLYGVAAWDCLLVLVWIADYLQLPGPLQLTVQRRWLAAPSLAVSSQVELELRNQGRMAVRTAVIDDLPAALRAEVAAVELAAVAGRSGRACYTIRPGQRGDIRAGKAYLRYRSVLPSEEKARAASRAMANMEGNFAVIQKEISEFRSDMDRRFSDTHRSISELRSYTEGMFRLHSWMLGTILAFLVALFFKVFSH